MRAIGVVVILGWAGAAWAQGAGDRPNEQDMFGGGSTQAPSSAPGESPSPPTSGAAPKESESPPSPGPHVPGSATTSLPPAAAAEGASRDQALLGGNTGGESQPLSDYIAPDNPLQIGGQLYLRAQSTAFAHENPSQWSLSAPSLLDAYFDARPNPRVRAFIQGRMSFDPTAAPGSATTNQVMNGSNGAFVGTSATGFTTFSNQRGPTTLLDQMWLRFDIENKVFVTAGTQHVHWGTGRYWQPTDYLHPIKRNPLDVFDARPGTTMLKVQVPWEALGWNFYGFAVTEDPSVATNTLGDVAGAFRAEIVVLGVELGADTFLRKGQGERFGFDMSTGIGDFDVYADVGVQSGKNFVHYFPDVPTVSGFTGYETQAVGGVTYQHKYNDNDMWTAGVEYFYNHPGYTNADEYAGALRYALNPSSGITNSSLVLPFFYLGRQYGAVFLQLPSPYSWNYTTFTLSTIGNLSDKSFVSRLDYSVTILTHLTVEAFAALHYGNVGGEFRFELPADIAAHAGGSSTYPVVDLGAALRLKF